MFITDFMTAPVKTVAPETPLAVARELMTSGAFRHLPVVDGEGRLVGIITDRDLRSAMPTGLMVEEESAEYQKRFKAVEVRAVMTPAVACLPAGATLDDALLLFDRTKVGALPVVDPENRVTGILSIRDLLTAYRRLFGLGARGTALVAVRDDGRPRVLSRLTGALEGADIPFTRLIHSGGVEGEGKPGGLIYVRVHTHNLNGVNQALAGAGFKVATPAPEKR